MANTDKRIDQLDTSSDVTGLEYTIIQDPSTLKYFKVRTADISAINGSITNEKIAANAAIDQSKIAGLVDEISTFKSFSGPIVGQENVQDTFLRQERKIDPNDFKGPEGIKCTIPSPDPTSADGEMTHPCVVYTPEKWNGYYYWMGVTPYTASSDQYEDPIIVASNDGITWEVPAGLVNPLDDQPGGTIYNSDTHLIFGPDNKLYLFWRYLNTSGSASGSEERMYLRTSSDGVTWTPKQLVYQSDMTVRRILSPSFYYINGVWHMWGIDIVSTKRVVYTTSTSLTPGSWATPQNCTVSLPSGRYPWHLFVGRVGDQWVALLNDTDNAGNSGRNGDNILMSSVDGLIWDVATTPAVPRAGTGYAVQYRSCFVPKVVGGIWSLEMWDAVRSPTNYVLKTSLTSIDYRPKSYGQMARLGLGGQAGTRLLRLTADTPEMEFIESDNSNKTWHQGVNGGIFKLTETGVMDRWLTQPLNQAYGTRYNETDTGTSGNHESVLINPTFNGSGTRSWTAYYVNIVDNSTGTGTKLAYRIGVNGVNKLTVDKDGLVTASNRIVGVSDPTGAQDAATKIYVDTAGWSTVPASASAAGTAGQKAYDSSYIYVCIATNTWKRTALSTW